LQVKKVLYGGGQIDVAKFYQEREFKLNSEGLVPVVIKEIHDKAGA
jgi:hypothetical protein